MPPAYRSYRHHRDSNRLGALHLDSRCNRFLIGIDQPFFQRPEDRELFRRLPILCISMAGNPARVRYRVTRIGPIDGKVKGRRSGPGRPPRLDPSAAPNGTRICAAIQVRGCAVFASGTHVLCLRRRVQVYSFGQKCAGANTAPAMRVLRNEFFLARPSVQA